MLEDIGYVWLIPPSSPTTSTQQATSSAPSHAPNYWQNPNLFPSLNLVPTPASTTPNTGTRIRPRGVAYGLPKQPAWPKPLGRRNAPFTHADFREACAKFASPKAAFKFYQMVLHQWLEEPLENEDVPEGGRHGRKGFLLQPRRQHLVAAPPATEATNFQMVLHLEVPLESEDVPEGGRHGVEKVGLVGAFWAAFPGSPPPPCTGGGGTSWRSRSRARKSRKILPSAGL